MKRFLHKTAWVAMLLLGCPLAGRAQKAGYDFLQTPPQGAAIDLSKVVCPAGSPATCHPFAGVPVQPQKIALQGVPLCPCTGAADTLMHRTQDVAADGKVPISVVALFLKNSVPVTLNGTPVDVYITVNHSNGVIGQHVLPQPDPLPESTGQLIVHPNGTFDSTIHVLADVIVVAKGAGANAPPKLHQRGPDVDLKSTGSPWSKTPPAGYPPECFFPGNGFYPGGAIAETAPSHSHPVAPAIDRTGFDTQPSFTGNCDTRPPGTVCLRFQDGYVWLIDEAVTGGTKTQDIQSAFGTQHIFLHILNTKLVKKVPKP
jgi:hypothetical protein